jgi:hypothetical protein
MNPPSSESPSMELPPVAEQAPDAVSSGEKAPAGKEQAPASAEKAPTAERASGLAAPAAPIIPLPPLPATTPVNQGTVVPATSAAAQVTDDNDLIEKEWVNKAKEIVERNRDDPYKQSEELTVFRADYMKKHYNKTIKLNK